MTSKHLADKLRDLMADIVQSMPDATPADLVRWTRENHGLFIQQFDREWADERLAALYLAMLGRRRPMKNGRPSLGHPQQSRLALSEQFERIPYFLLLEPRTREKRGREVKLPLATLEDLKQRRAFIRGEMSLELPQLNSLIQLMELYDKARPGITVGEALRLRATAKREQA